jgi:hypothetical protein
MSNHSSKKKIFLKLTTQIYSGIDIFENGIRLSSLKDDNLIEEIKTLKVIELDNLESFESYINYDHYLIFKLNECYYFCDTNLIPAIKFDCLIKINDYNQILRKDKIKKIDNIS